MNSRALIFKLAACCAAALLLLAPAATAGQGAASRKVVRSDEEWRRLLTPEQFEVLRRKGTEAPYSSPLNKVKGRGTFVCAASRGSLAERTRPPVPSVNFWMTCAGLRRSRAARSSRA